MVRSVVCEKLTIISIVHTEAFELVFFHITCPIVLSFIIMRISRLSQTISEQLDVDWAILAQTLLLLGRKDCITKNSAWLFVPDLFHVSKFGKDIIVKKFSEASFIFHISYQSLYKGY